MTELLLVPSVTSSPSLGITEDGQKTKDRLLAQSGPIIAVTDEKSRDRAIKIAGAIRAHLKEVEASRVEVKKPFLQLSREIDNVAANHIQELEVDLRHLNRLVGTFENERQEKLRQERNQLTEQEKSKDLATVLEAEERLEELATIEPVKAKGGALRHDWDIEVTDIKALYLAHPQCVELIARNLAIKDLLKVGITPAGVRATPKAVFAARATNKPKQLS